MCITGNDFGDCYDRVAHPIASIALQSWGVPQEPIRILLSAMQTMHFFICTGFGKSAVSYGGTNEDCTLGLGQGNAAAGPGLLSVSSLIVDSYLREGHGMRRMTSYSQQPFDLAAVIYVDNKDLPHMPKDVMASMEELIAHSQRSTNVWGGLSIATGAALKPEKCYAYFMAYVF
jgi:hypothetical protein